MELQKLIELGWELIEKDILDGDEVPDLDYCQEELNILSEGIDEDELKEKIGWKPRSE